MKEAGAGSYFNPGYPSCLAGCRLLAGDSLLAVKIAHILFDIATAVALSWLLLRTCSTLTVLFFTIAFALHPLLLHLCNNVNDEPPAHSLRRRQLRRLVSCHGSSFPVAFHAGGISLGTRNLHKEHPDFSALCHYRRDVPCHQKDESQPRDLLARILARRHGRAVTMGIPQLHRLWPFRLQHPWHWHEFVVGFRSSYLHHVWQSAARRRE